MNETSVVAGEFTGSRGRKGIWGHLFRALGTLVKKKDEEVSEARAEWVGKKV